MKEFSGAHGIEYTQCSTKSSHALNRAVETAAQLAEVLRTAAVFNRLYEV
jgi:hypothetical protein